MKSAVDTLRLKRARTALKRANLAYLDDHLELALAYQTKVMDIVEQIKGKSDFR